MVKQAGESEVENQTQIENKPITKKEPKKPKTKKEPVQNPENSEDKQPKSNAGRPKKNEVSLENLTFQFTTTSYNISAFSVEFRQNVMCYGNNDPANQYQFNDLFSQYGKKNNKSYFTKENLEDLSKRIEEKKMIYDDIKYRLYNFCENIKLQTDEYYKGFQESQQLEHQILDKLLEFIAEDENYQFNKSDFENIDKCKIILPHFWETVAKIMISERQSKIYQPFLELLD